MSTRAVVFEYMRESLRKTGYMPYVIFLKQYEAAYGYGARRYLDQKGLAGVGYQTQARALELLPPLLPDEEQVGLARLLLSHIVRNPQHPSAIVSEKNSVAFFKEAMIDFCSRWDAILSAGGLRAGYFEELTLIGQVPDRSGGRPRLSDDAF